MVSNQLGSPASGDLEVNAVVGAEPASFQSIRVSSEWRLTALLSEQKPPSGFQSIRVSSEWRLLIDIQMINLATFTLVSNQLGSPASGD